MQPSFPWQWIQESCLQHMGQDLLFSFSSWPFLAQRRPPERVTFSESHSPGNFWWIQIFGDPKKKNRIVSTIYLVGCILIHPLELDMPRQLNVTWWFGGSTWLFPPPKWCVDWHDWKSWHRYCCTAGVIDLEALNHTVKIRGKIWQIL